jgi:predicted CoA-substrate-specific enzyme activase
MRDARYLGLDLGAERVKVAEVLVRDGVARPGRTWMADHGKDPTATLARLLPELEWSRLDGAAVTGRMAAALTLTRVPGKAVVAAGLELLHPDLADATVVSIGSQGFFVAEVVDRRVRHLRENSRCSQGTGNFLRQLVERFGLSLPEADALCENVKEPSPLSGRCPVILKTDMTHLANRGEDRDSILAGLYDAVCENVLVLVRPRESPRNLLLIGGVTRSARIRNRIAEQAQVNGMQMVAGTPEQDQFLEAFGAAVLARQAGTVVPEDSVLAPREARPFETFPGLQEAMSQVVRMPAKPLVKCRKPHDVVVGFDIGSTGSKAVALDVHTLEPVWQAWRKTLGDPVGAAKGLVTDFLEGAGQPHRVRGVAATGSGREIVGSLLSACFGAERVFVLNEIAAHAEGALHHDPDVDTIFEIGGQDAKYIRLDHGRVTDAAMNEACSAGTGSFIEEQGRKFEGVDDVASLGRLAIQSDHGVSLGQHCSVFMAELIDHAVSAGQSRDAILAGLYDSVVQNYVKRVKGTRSIGQRIFCQGMPFLSDALAAAVARHTGQTVVIPPDPGTVGALGIALLALRDGVQEGEPLAFARFLDVHVQSRDTFICPSTKGCGGSGNHCRIDRLDIAVDGAKGRFTWGGSCSMYDKGTRKKKLPDGAPDPFREREEAVKRILEALPAMPGQPIVAMTDEFTLKGLIPFFATFVSRLGLDVRVFRGGNHDALRRGIEQANIPWCAPMQLFHGVVRSMLEEHPDILLAPMVVDLPQQGNETNSVTCPVVQAAPGVIREAFFREGRTTRLVAPVVRMAAGGLDATDFKAACRALARDLGAEGRWEDAWQGARDVQQRFDEDCLDIGRRALAFADDQSVVPVVVLGRAYTLYNDVLNSNVPVLLRKQGALAIPVDCYPLESDVPVFQDVYWHYGQANLRAAHQVRRTDGVYSVFCSNYSCGPDSFNLHFNAYVMRNKPFAVIETDGHSGDAGTATRIEAFLHCVQADQRSTAQERGGRPRTRFRAMELEKQDLAATRHRGDILLINPMGAAAPITAAMLRSEGLRAEVLPMPDREALELGRRHTSGKECLPMTLTLGSVLQRLEKDRDSEETFALLMPSASGPCRFGVYNLLHKIAFEQAGWKDRMRIVSPEDTDYFAGLPTDFQLRLWFGMVAADLLLASLHDVRPVETVPGATQKVFDRRYQELIELLEHPRAGDLPRTLREAGRGMYGIRELVGSAAREMAALKDAGRWIPTVAVVGEIYVRLDPFANDFVIERLERAGVRARLAPFNEWIEYTSWTRKKRMRMDRLVPGENVVEIHISSALQETVLDRLYGDVAGALGWSRRTRVRDAMRAGERYVSEDLMGEAILTVGGPIHEYLDGTIDGVVSVGPLECMPNKIAESHFLRADEDLGLPSLTLALNGDPLDDRVIQDFVFEVRERAARRKETPAPARRPSLANQLHDARSVLVRRLLGLVPPLPSRSTPPPGLGRRTA